MEELWKGKCTEISLSIDNIALQAKKVQAEAGQVGKKRESTSPRELPNAKRAALGNITNVSQPTYDGDFTFALLGHSRSGETRSKTGTGKERHCGQAWCSSHQGRMVTVEVDCTIEHICSPILVQLV